MGRKTYSGTYKVINRSKYKGNPSKITYRSSWELSFMKWCDNNDKVIKWNSEEVVVPYFSKVSQKNRRYFVDFYIKLDDGREFLTEIKPASQTKPPKPPTYKTNKSKQTYLYNCGMYVTNVDKWHAANLYAKKKNMEFVVLTEHKLRNMGIKV